MSFRLALILFTLFLIGSQRPYSFRWKEKKTLPMLNGSTLARAYLFGEKKALKKKEKKIHKELNLQHLMTPSGLHLASLLLLLGLFTKKKNHRFLFLLLIAGFTYPYDGLDSFKRMLLFGLLRTNPIINLKTLSCFLLTFLFTFTGGQYSENPLSFTLSFIFLAALLRNDSKLATFSLLFFVQALLSDWFGSLFYPLGAIYGLMVSLLSPLLFPFLIVESLIPSFEMISKLWLDLLSHLSDAKGPGFHFPFFIFVIPVLFFTHKKMRNFALPLALLFCHLPVNPRPKGVAFVSPPPKGAEKIGRVKRGYRLDYENGMRCFSRMKGDQWSTHCYQ